MKFNPETGSITGKAFVRKGCGGCIDAVCDSCTPAKFWVPPATPEEIAEGLAWVKSLRAARNPPTPTAPDILTAAAKHMADRAKTYDKPSGERSMGRTVEAFNAITGRDLQESEGWLLMQIIKDVRDRQRADPHVDSLEDGVAYAALKAEARMGGR